MKLKLLLTICCIAAPGFTHAAPLLFDISAESAYDNNLSQTPDALGGAASGIHSQIDASARKGFVLSEDFSFMVKLGAGYHDFNIEESADYWNANAVLAMTYKPFDRFSAPLFKSSISAVKKNYSNDFSTDLVYRARLSMFNQLTDRLSTNVGVAYRMGDHEWAPVDTLNDGYWDTEEMEYFISADMRLDLGTLYGKISYKDGDRIWTRPVANGFISDLWDDAQTLQLNLGFNLPVSSSAAIDILGSYYEVRRNGMQMYDRSSLSLAYLHRF